MIYNLLKLVLLLSVATFFFQSQFFTRTDPKAPSPLLLVFGHTNYSPVIDYVHTGLCFFTSPSPHSRDRFLASTPHLPSCQRATQALSGGCAALLW